MMNALSATTRAVWTGCLLLALVLMAGCAAAHKPGVQVEQLPRIYDGHYFWANEHCGATVVLTINDIKQRGDGTIEFTGSNVYERFEPDASNTYSPQDWKMKVHGNISPGERRVVLRESEPSKPNAVVDGSFEGVLSRDLRSLVAIWTTESTGALGALILQAR